ncbi:spondin domain-containing protein [Pseudoalteromonas obscura]|uniref:Spondin domain-containing protein n=1 Tax=Pseudoalteromonas obscura TaxID=3048491 RepID=A0ABT7EL56_9GAMM|nr:spondin domain-containing protein [Pseudoalteromonas sp. P94(2023)]MDK2595771.1 spondin domain-containing protein [Pseudoalteromonas sp. P94(2023)]
MINPLKLATLCIVMGLTACGGSSSSSPTNSAAATTAPTTNTSTGSTTTTTPAPANTVTYELTFTRTWERSNFPTNYPNGTHFSPVIGLTHNEQGRIFQRETSASAGIASMAETGSKTLLKNEISDIQNLGNSSYLIDEAGISGNSKSVSMTFEASQSFPYLSVVSMVAPSPDWFIGIDSLLLFNDNQWVDEQTIQLKVYDAGSDSGTTFSAADSPTDPQATITLLSSERADTDFTNGVHFTSGENIGFIKITLMQ